MDTLNENPSSTQQIPPTKTSNAENFIASIFVGPQGIRAGWRWLIFLVILVLFASALFGIALATHLLRLPSPGAALAPSFVTLQEVIVVIAMFLTVLIMSKIEKRPIEQYGLPAREAFGRRFWQGIIWGFIAITVLVASIAALHGFAFGKVTLAGRSLAGYALLWGFAFLLTGFFEEFTFRGYSQFTLTTGMGFWPAAIFLSLLFGAIHLGNSGEALTGGLSAALIGFFFCFTLRRTGSIWFAVGLHAAWDYGETFVYGVPDSGIVAPGHLLNSSFHGPRWLTGGTVGPEASVACFIVLGLLFLIFHFVYPARLSKEDTV